MRSPSVPETSWSAANGSRYTVSPAVTSPAEAWNVPCSSGIRTTRTPPPNGPRNPPRYSAARATRSRADGPSLTRSAGVRAPSRPTGCQTPSGQPRASVRAHACSPATSQRRPPGPGAAAVFAPGRRRGLGRDEQRRRTPGGAPGVAGVVERVVDPGQGTAAGVALDRPELPVDVRLWWLEGDKRGTNGQT